MSETSPTMPWAPGCSRGDPFDALAAAGDEGDAGAAAESSPHERQPQAGGAAGDGDAHAAESPAR